MTTRRLLDLSIPICNDVVTDPPAMLPSITYMEHRETVPQILSFFPGLQADELPDGMGWAVERVTMSTHAGTHVDAPWHYHPTMDDGARAITIDEAPLDYFFQRGVKLDFRHLPDGYFVTPGDIIAELQRIGHVIEPLDIVLINTAAGAAYGADDYLSKGCGVGQDGTLYLLDKGVKVTGTDAWSWDPPFVHTAKRFAEERDPAIIWSGHKAGRFKEYYHIEKLTRLDELPSTGFTLSCFPVKVKGGSAGWIRAVAIID